MIHTHYFYFFFFNDTATTEIYTLSLHDALPISIDEDAFFAGNGRCQAIHRHLHAGHGIRRMQAQERRRKKIPRSLRIGRSEEHTSELQSQSNLVCRLLLEKKKIHI